MGTNTESNPDLGPNERAMLERAAQNQLRNQGDAAKALGLTSAEVKGILSALQKRQMLSKESGGYQITPTGNIALALPEDVARDLAQQGRDVPQDLLVRVDFEAQLSATSEGGSYTKLARIQAMRVYLSGHGRVQVLGYEDRGAEWALAQLRVDEDGAQIFPGESTPSGSEPLADEQVRDLVVVLAMAMALA